MSGTRPTPQDRGGSRGERGGSRGERGAARTVLEGLYGILLVALVALGMSLVGLALAALSAWIY